MSVCDDHQPSGMATRTLRERVNAPGVSVPQIVPKSDSGGNMQPLISERRRSTMGSRAQVAYIVLYIAHYAQDQQAIRRWS